MYQLPDQQFANLYWFRYDWFTDPDDSRSSSRTLRAPTSACRSTGRPTRTSPSSSPTKVNGTAPSSGKKVYGHMDYGRKDPSLGWRFTDAWLSMAGNGGPRHPHPACRWTTGASGWRRTAARSASSVDPRRRHHGPAAVYALTKYVDWLKKYAPGAGRGHELQRGRPWSPPASAIAQQIFLVHRVHRRHDQGGAARSSTATARPKWRMAPAPTARYWKAGPADLGYQGRKLMDLLKNTPQDAGREPGSTRGSSPRRQSR